MLDRVENYLKYQEVNHIRIGGSIQSNERNILVKSFQHDDKCRVAVLALTSCSTGITLTKASTVIFAELYFTPAIMIQAEDRTHRIGQKKQVNIIYLYGLATMDEILYPRLRDKYFIVSTILDDNVSIILM